MGLLLGPLWLLWLIFDMSTNKSFLCDYGGPEDQYAMVYESREKGGGKLSLGSGNVILSLHHTACVLM